MGTITRWLLAVAVLLAACSATSRSTSPVDLPTEDFPAMDSPTLDAERQAAILAGTAAGPQYNSDPPTSGPHADDYARCGIYRVEVPDIYQVASLMRGTVLIQYQPSLPAATREALEEVGRTLGRDVIVAPRPGLDSPIVLTAWTKRLALEAVDVDVIEAFHAANAQRAPANADCPMTVQLAE